MKPRTHLYILKVLLVFFGCASFRSDVSDLYLDKQAPSHVTQVKLFFDLYHYHQAVGKDIIPKLLYSPGVDDWNDLFKESLKNLTNTAGYRTFTNTAFDINEPPKRYLRDSLMSDSDYTIKIEILRKKSFVKHYLGGLASVLTLTIVPMPYTWDYSVSVTVMNRSNTIVGKYERNASVTTWYQILLLFVYPFYVEEKQNEEIYLEMVSNIFRQIDSDGILK